jgi:hypothetical protein
MSAAGIAPEHDEKGGYVRLLLALLLQAPDDQKKAWFRTRRSWLDQSQVSRYRQRADGCPDRSLICWRPNRFSIPRQKHPAWRPTPNAVSPVLRPRDG